MITSPRRHGRPSIHMDAVFFQGVLHSPSLLRNQKGKIGIRQRRLGVNTGQGQSMQAANGLWKSVSKVLPWLVVLSAGFVLRIWQLRDQLLADDEWHALRKLTHSDFAGIFSSFGYSDHSIPLTLYYKALSLTTGLSEWSMHVPLLLAGLLSLLAVPWLLRATLRSPEPLLLASLVALSPMLVYFSRTARPYALSALLAFAALIAFYNWWNKPGHRWGLTYVATAALSAWLHPVTLALTLTPFVFFGVAAIRDVMSTRELHKLVRISLLGIAMLAVLSALLAVPIYHDYSLFLNKRGTHAVSLASLWVTLSLFTGSANTFVIVAWLVLAAAGFRELLKRQAMLAWYFVFAVILSGIIVAATSAIMLHHPLVLARYTLPGIFVLLALVALGLSQFLQALPGFLRLPVIVAALLVYALTGPLPAQYNQPLNQFMGHMVYQADYDRERNRYARHFRQDESDVPAFYRDLAELPPDSVTLVVAPWYLEWHWNAWHLNQQVHRQRILAGFISGLCVDKTYGEYPPGQPGIELTNIVHLTELAKQQTATADYLVYEKNMPFQPPGRARPDIDFSTCEQQIDELFGPPVIDDGKILVYTLR